MEHSGGWIRDCVRAGSAYSRSFGRYHLLCAVEVETGGGTTTDPDKPTGPSDSGNSGETEIGNNASTSPQTGDADMGALWLSLLLAAITGATAATVAIKRGKAK